MAFFRQLSQARQEGRVRVSIVGLGVDPLSFVCDLLTVAVFDADVFDRLFGGLVSENAEGDVVNDGGTSKRATTGPEALIHILPAE